MIFIYKYNLIILQTNKLTNTMISHVTIKNMSNDAASIAATLKELDFFMTSKICLFPIFENGKFTYTAYIRVGEWIDCNMAYMVVKAMKDGKNTVAYVKELSQLWELKKTTAEDMCYTEDSRFSKWTTEIDPVDSDTESEYSEYESDVETIMRAEVKAPDEDFSEFGTMMIRD